MSEALLDAMAVPHPPVTHDARIVSLVPSVTELCFELGLGAQVVGRTKFCVHPASAVSEVPRVGGTKDVDVERVRTLAPTHVLVNVDENRRETVEALRGFVPNVVVTHPLGPADNLDLYRLIGGIFGRAREAEELCERFAAAQRRLDERVRGLPRRRVLYLIWRDPWMGVGPDTYIARFLAQAGWTNLPLVTPDRYPVVDLGSSELAELDLVLLSSEPYPFKPEHQRELALALPHARPVLVDGERLSWYGSRAIAGLEYLGDLALELG